MEKNSHPLCACGTPVIVREHMVPCYDDGGSVDSFEPVLEFEDVCYDCYKANEEKIFDERHRIESLPFHMRVMREAAAQEEDDLPF